MYTSILFFGSMCDNNWILLIQICFFIRPRVSLWLMEERTTKCITLYHKIGHGTNTLDHKAYSNIVNTKVTKLVIKI